MGLTLYYDWKWKADAAAARRMIAKFHALASKLPFDEVTEILERHPPGGEFKFAPYEYDLPHGDLYLTRKRADGANELVNVPALHAVFFYARVEGAETATIGLASHPPVVVHREDVIVLDDEGREYERRIGAGDPIEFPTRRRGYYSWHSFCKTQYAGNPKLGGEANFLKAHLTLIELLDQMKATGVPVRVRDDSKYAQHRDVNRLLKSLREWNGIIASFAGRIKDALGGDSANVIAPITERPDFEHLEADGIKMLQKLVARQRHRKKKRKDP
jgi:hypothetical protein